MNKPNYSNFLFTDPSFIEGIARLLDFGGTLSQVNYSPTPEQADALAIKADWLAVGADLRATMEKFAADHPGIGSHVECG